MCPRILIFIKPYDEEVFINFFKLLRYIMEKQTELNICISIVMP